VDDNQTRTCIQDHADAVVRGDMDAILEDFAPDLRPQVPQIAQVLPQPVNSAEVLGIDAGEEESTSTIRYAGEADAVTIRASWRDVEGRPRIVNAEPVS